METNDKMIEAYENKIKTLEKQSADLESKLGLLKIAVKDISDKIENNLLKQIEILTVFVAIISLIITNVIGIDAFGNVGIVGLLKIDGAFVISVFVLLLCVKFVILGSKKR